MDKSSTFSSLGQFLRANRAFFLIVLLLVVTVGGYFWWRSGFSLDFSRFFAAEGVTCSQTPFLDPSAVCADAASACTNRQQYQGTRIVDGDGNYSYCFECPAGALDVCNPPDAPPTPTPEPDVSDRYVDATFTNNSGGAHIINTTYQDQRPVSYCVFDMSAGFTNQVLIAHKIFYIGARSTMDVNLSQVYAECGARTLQLDLIRGDSCGEAPYHHAGFLFDAIIGLNYSGGACVTQPPQTSQPPPETSQPPPPETSEPPPPASSEPPPPASSEPPPPATSQPPEEEPLSCSPAQQNATVGQSVSVSASGGTGTYAWTAPGGAPANANGTPFSVSYDTPGYKTVVVSSGGNQVACTIQVAPAAASSPPPPTELVCTPANQNAFSGQQVQIAGAGGSRPYAWTASQGTPSSGGDVTPFSVAFTNNQASASTFLVTLRDATASASAVCRVSVSCAVPSCEEPPEGCSYEESSVCSCGTLVCPSGTPLSCSPSSRTLNQNQQATWNAGGGTPPYTWTAPGSADTAGGGSAHTTSYTANGGYTLTVRDSLNASATCTVTVTSGSTSTTPSLDIEKTVRNVTTNGPERDSTEAKPVQTVEFIVLISARGNGTARQVVARDTLPAGLSYVAGSTTIDNAAAADGITAGGLNLGDMAPGRSITVRFRALAAQEAFFSPGTTVLTNVAFARGSNVSEDSDDAYVSVVRSAANASMTLWKAGRNVTRNETGEHALILASPNNTLEFFLHVRNTSATALANVIVRDALPTQVLYVAGSARLNGSPIADTLATSGVNIGTLAQGAEALVTFQGRVGAPSQFSAGRTNLVNTVYARADGISELMAQLPIVVELTVAPVTEVETGPGDSALLALAVSAIITLLYVGYTGTEVYRRREVQAIAKDSHSDHDLFDFKR
jgi:uncharacterized repeat protein (TIGR01451 family)